MTTLDELLALAEQATPGPWHADEVYAGVDDDGEEVATGWFRDCDLGTVDVGDYNTLRWEDARYIAALSPEVVKALVAVAEAAEWMRDVIHGEWCAFNDHGEPCQQATAVVDALKAVLA